MQDEQWPPPPEQSDFVATALKKQEQCAQVRKQFRNERISDWFALVFYGCLACSSAFNVRHDTMARWVLGVTVIAVCLNVRLILRSYPKEAQAIAKIEDAE